MKIADVISCGMFDTDVAFPMMKQTHPRTTEEFEIEFIISCDGTSVIDGVHRRLVPQTLLVVHPGQVRMTCLRFKCYFLHLSPDMPEEYRRLLSECPTWMNLRDSTAYRDLFEDLIRHILTEEGAADSDYTSAKLLELFYYIRQDAGHNRGFDGQVSQRVNKVVSSACDYINRNFASDITLAELAAAADYSPNHFHRIFCDCMGTTPQKYLLDVRIRQAKYMLARPEKILSEIAYACGFSSQAYFGSIFRRQTSLTPGEYRRFCMSNYS